MKKYISILVLFSAISVNAMNLSLHAPLDRDEVIFSVSRHVDNEALKEKSPELSAAKALIAAKINDDTKLFRKPGFATRAGGRGAILPQPDAENIFKAILATYTKEPGAPKVTQEVIEKVKDLETQEALKLVHALRASLHDIDEAPGIEYNDKIKKAKAFIEATNILRNIYGHRNVQGKNFYETTSIDPRFMAVTAQEAYSELKKAAPPARKK